MAARDFHLVTCWRIPAQIGDVADILTLPQDFPRWWGQVYLAIRQTDPGDADGIGRRIEVHSRGWLPYHLHWQGTLVESDLPHRWVIDATGDLTGRGEWRLVQRGPVAEVTFDWRIRADRPLFRLLAPLFAPVLAWNHRWAMAQGEEGLRSELARRSQAK